MNLGDKILEIRKKKNITQEELAAELGVTAAAVSKWENGYTLPDLFMLCALADYFNVTTDELLGRVKELKYAVIAAETPELGKKVEEMAKRYGVVAVSVHTDYEEARVSIREHESVQYFICCFINRQGYVGDDSGVENLVSVAPTEEKVLLNIQRVFDQYLKD